MAMERYVNSLNITTFQRRLALKFCGNFSFNNNRHFNLFSCIQKFKLKASQHKGISPVTTRQRKLLSLEDGISEQNATRKNATKATKEETERFNEFLATIERKLSKDPQRAMYSILFLLVMVVAAMKLCGMRMAKNIREEPQDFESQVLYMNVYDIIKMKKAYLPQKLIQWNRKVRRKLRKKKTIQRAPLIEQDLGDPPSDNTDEEKMIYADVCDF